MSNGFWWLFLLIGLLAGAGIGYILAGMMTASSLEDRISEIRSWYDHRIAELQAEIERLKK